MDPQSQTRLITIEQLSERTGIPIRTLRRWKDAGRIPFFQPAGKNGKIWFLPDALERAAGLEKPIPEANSKTKKMPGSRPKWQT